MGALGGGPGQSWAVLGSPGAVLGSPGRPLGFTIAFAMGPTVAPLQ